jgi:4-alpha-glucanotransferase
MRFKRAAGVLLHPTSLPGPDGIGDLGPEAFRWVDFLAGAGCALWQILPLGPTGYGDSPYQCFSAFAGNPYLVSPAILLDEGLLTPGDLSDRPEFPSQQVDYGPVIEWKLTLLDRAYDRFVAGRFTDLKKNLTAFKEAQSAWLDDYALFMAIKEAHQGVSWDHWPAALRRRDTSTLQAFRENHAASIDRHIFRQFLFFRQWDAVHIYAASKDIRIIGDVPIFVSYDSSDVWSHPELFYLDEDGSPTVVAGVPPDYFSPTGQLWGNPLYRWDVHAANGYAWWIERLRATLRAVDYIRLDHFRGFTAYWEVPASETTAIKGRWVPGPGQDFFRRIEQEMRDLPVIAEDLGVITPDVVAMREAFQLPGMKVLQFAFSTDADDPFLPHNYPQNCVAYTGTHDNDTTLGWYTGSSSEEERDLCRRYLARSGEDIAWDMIRAAWSSVAVMAMTPMQDLLSLGNEARINYPCRASGNWSWRMPASVLNASLSNRLKEMNTLYSRVAGQPEKKIHKSMHGAA